MSQPGFREIQLSGKQVVFAFIAGVVVLVGAFLLGVSVGRNVATPASAESDPVELVERSPTTPVPTTTPAPGELQFHDTLQGRTPAPQAAAATPPPQTPTPTPELPPIPPPTRPTPTPTPTTRPAAPAAGIYVQVNSFGGRENAQRQVTELKKLGITSAIFNVPGPAPYKVRVGPFTTEAEAIAMRTRLEKQGFKPSLIR
jgi:cell division protein FtsN